MTDSFLLSAEQQAFIRAALSGRNILVDACIGSGKTTAIQCLCDALPRRLRILYLTYNKLLKLDARARIRSANTTVTNYHGFAYAALRRAGIAAGVSDLIRRFNTLRPPFQPYDVLIIDEYQDIEQEFSELLEIIREANPSMQIIAVGDMQQKIYDKTMLDVSAFIDRFLGSYERMMFTQCFRLSAEHAEMLGRIWKKPIVGVNTACLVEDMTLREVASFLSAQNPRDVLCLGSRDGDMSDMLNLLEANCPERYNKNTVFASITGGDAVGRTQPNRDTAIFTTYDSSKGLERKICVVFDFTESYWQVRIRQPLQAASILRNIFCVAASRGKEHIIFVRTDEQKLSEQTLSEIRTDYIPFSNMNIADMFHFKYRENIEECYSLIQVNKLPQDDGAPIHVNTSDGLIDLSPCISLYQKAIYFQNYEIDKEIELKIELNSNKRHLCNREIRQLSPDRKILFSTYLDTNQERYFKQVETPFVSSAVSSQICSRLQTLFAPDEEVQQLCRIDFASRQGGSLAFSAIGYADVIKDRLVYSVHFCSQLSHEQFLECACFMLGAGLNAGRLWNVRDNSLYEITVPDRKAFLDAVAKAVTKQEIPAYFEPRGYSDETYFAVIDTETNWSDRVMSVGIVIADAQLLQPVAQKYYILTPEYKVGGMFSNVLNIPLPCESVTLSRADTVADMRRLFECFGVRSLFAYNAKFDQGHLPEVNYVDWYDIMQVAVYRQFNPKIPADAPCCKTGRLKRGGSVQAIYRLLSGNDRYYEQHNALTDAVDELEIMRMLGQPLDVFRNPKSAQKKAKKQPEKLPEVPVGTEVYVKGKGDGTVTEINRHIIKVEVGGTTVTFTRKDAFERGWLTLK